MYRDSLLRAAPAYPWSRAVIVTGWLRDFLYGLGGCGRNSFAGSVQRHHVRRARHPVHRSRFAQPDYAVDSSDAVYGVGKRGRGDYRDLHHGMVAVAAGAGSIPADLYLTD